MSILNTIEWQPSDPSDMKAFMERMEGKTITMEANVVFLLYMALLLVHENSENTETYAYTRNVVEGKLRELGATDQEFKKMEEGLHD